MGIIRQRVGDEHEAMRAAVAFAFEVVVPFTILSDIQDEVSRHG
jgi:NAD-dependent DNA ligase